MHHAPSKRQQVFTRPRGVALQDILIFKHKLSERQKAHTVFRNIISLYHRRNQISVKAVTRRKKLNPNLRARYDLYGFLRFTPQDISELILLHLEKRA